MRRLLAASLPILLLACKSPLAELPRQDAPALALAPVRVEDHSRQLKRLRAMEPDEANTPEARRAALDAHGAWLEGVFRAEAGACGIQVRPDAPLRLELVVTDLGEVRAKYIVLGIASGVAWGVGTGLVAHNTRLAVGLGAYELVEETVFWIGGSSLFSSFSAPAVVEARLFRTGESQPVWHEAYYVLSGRAWTKGLPDDLRHDRSVQIRASLQKVILKALGDLERVPGFPQHTKATLTADPMLIPRILTPDPAPPVTGITPPERHSVGCAPEHPCPPPASP